ncbi:MAG: hypothetical protein Ct9H300mP27_03500 [Chloroflexota bacterium]|nr:MAG: hypothetical protein Ct9H300mP27_03500 [Chloroflexota bacterium]
MIVSVSVIEKVFKIDDPVSAISVHGTTGLWGLLAVGIFANGNNGVTGLLAGNGLQIIPIDKHRWGFWPGPWNRLLDFSLTQNNYGSPSYSAEETLGLDDQSTP